MDLKYQNLPGEARGNRRLRRGDCINIDLAGAVPQGYCGDLCRGMGFKEMPKEYYKIVPIVIKAIDEAVFQNYFKSIRSRFK